jgi:SAM-dependent methyltransferase
MTGTPQGAALRGLLGASFLTLFAELGLIRWIAVEVRIFAYVKNLALLLCFLGFGVGCALAKLRDRALAASLALMALIALVRGPFLKPDFWEGLSGALGAGTDIQIWAPSVHVDWLGVALAAGVVTVLMVLLVLVFVPLGQRVSREIDRAPSALRAYSWNLVGSLAGILAFFGCCRWMLPPTVWLSVVLFGLALLQERWTWRLGLSLLVVPAALLLNDPSSADRFALWTPYQQIAFSTSAYPDGSWKSATVSVNHTGYQWIVDMSPEFLSRHPLPHPPEEDAYNMPFRFSIPRPSVLVVGSGTGNDVAAASRAEARQVDAVEIDPAILQLGRQKHPEHPYDSPHTSAHLTDARAYLKRASEGYDLILFALLDSHTQLSDLSNMRVDNFVYTEESFEEAKRLLGPDGVLFVKFSVIRPWLGRRLAQLAQRVFGKAPLVFQVPDEHVGGLTCIAISRSGRVEQALAADPKLAAFVNAHALAEIDHPTEVPTTDDWPYLYQERRAVPQAFITVGVLVLLVAFAFYRRLPDAGHQLPSLFFFAMGAGFLLLETQVISRLALYFGTTWQVNGIVIAAVLSAALLANTVTPFVGKLPRWGLITGLLAGLVAAYFVPFSRLAAPPVAVGVMAAALFSVPVFFAGLLFASVFQHSTSPGAALGANVLGAVAGGLLENLSLVFGMRALVWVAFVLYCLAALGLRAYRYKTPSPAIV